MAPWWTLGTCPLWHRPGWGRKWYPGEKEPAQGRLGCNLTIGCLRAAPSAVIHSCMRCQALAQLTPILQGGTKHWALDGGKATWPAQRDQLLRPQPPAAPAAAPAPQRYCASFPGPHQDAGEYFCFTLSCWMDAHKAEKTNKNKICSSSNTPFIFFWMQRSELPPCLWNENKAFCRFLFSFFLLFLSVVIFFLNGS